MKLPPPDGWDGVLTWPRTNRRTILVVEQNCGQRTEYGIIGATIVRNPTLYPETELVVATMRARSARRRQGGLTRERVCSLRQRERCDDVERETSLRGDRNHEHDIESGLVHATIPPHTRGPTALGGSSAGEQEIEARNM
jgi:hypothetical protein